MAQDDQQRLQDLERRLNALEGGQGGSAQSGSTDSTDQGNVDPQDAANIQAFLTGALVAGALAQGGGAQAGGQGEGTGAAFASIFGCGGGGWNPTKYDSFFWCKSRFMCNPQSLSCLC